jgi:small-conductance mechanosensitive channel
MYKLQISDLKAQLDDIKQTMQSDNFKLDNFNQVIMQELQHIKESDAVMKSDIENIKNIISKSLSQPTTATPTTAPSTATPTTAEPTTAEPTTAPSTAEPTTAPCTAPSTAETTTATPTTAPSTAEPTNLLNNEINNTTTDSDLLTQLTSEPQKVTVAVPKAPRGRRPRK